MTEITQKPQESNPTPPKKGIFIKVWDKIPSNLKTVLIKFYSNKKVFLPISISFGLIFLVIILGLLFGTRGTEAPISKKTPVPASSGSPTMEPGNALSQIQLQLIKLKDQVLGLDVNQSRLKPPPVNFEIRF